ncbi:MAG: TetR/AcrR family transcriptional regulator [Myxococcales bacterium]|nr:TetR/AcrR family transcriptional regulator [Myxococcales bacterium]
MAKLDRRQELLAAASRVFATRGYHDAKVEDIGAAAGVAKGTVYLYFRDKRSIMSELVDSLFVRISSAIVRFDTEGDVAGQAKHNIRAVLGVVVDDPDSMRILFDHASGVDPAFRAKIDSFYAGLRQLLTESLEDGQREGLVREGDARLYASFTIGAMREILIEAGRGPVSSRMREEIVEALFRVLVHGYLRSEVSAPTTPPETRAKLRPRKA